MMRIDSKGRPLGEIGSKPPATWRRVLSGSLQLALLPAFVVGFAFMAGVAFSLVHLFFGWGWGLVQ